VPLTVMVWPPSVKVAENEHVIASAGTGRLDVFKGERFFAGYRDGSFHAVWDERLVSSHGECVRERGLRVRRRDLKTSRDL